MPKENDFKKTKRLKNGICLQIAYSLVLLNLKSSLSKTYTSKAVPETEVGGLEPPLTQATPRDTVWRPKDSIV